jgi:hypothetical protein
MPWRFLEELPPTNAEAGRAADASGQPGSAFVLSYLIWKLGDLELEMEDLESSADTVDHYLALRRLTATRDNLAGAADEVIGRRLAAAG